MRKFWTLVAAAALVVGCSEDLTSDLNVGPDGSLGTVGEGITLEVSVEDVTRVDVEKGKPAWEVGDCLTLVHDGKSYEYKAVTGERDEVYVDGGKKSGIVFTADADDLYNISLDDYYNDDAYFNNIKVFTDSKTIYEGKNENFADVEINLKKDEKVYFNIYSEYDTRFYVNVSKIKSKISCQ